MPAGDLHTGGDAFNNSHQSRTMGFTGSQPTQHIFHPATYGGHNARRGRPTASHITSMTDALTSSSSRLNRRTCSTAWYSNISRPGTTAPPPVCQTDAIRLGQG